MEIRHRIESVFKNCVFDRPLFYTYPGGLRFELSEGGMVIQQFLLAIQKATLICSDIFPAGESIAFCFRCRAEKNRFAHRPLLREITKTGIKFSRNRSLWLEPLDVEEWFEENEPESWLTLAFDAPQNLIQSALWCALAIDFGSISPRPLCSVYLVNLTAGIVVFPYDDRGMDVVGPNHERLASIYGKHRKYLLDYDLKKMEATFGVLQLLNDRPGYQ